MRERYLTEGQWERLLPLLPPQRPATGRPANDHRQVVEAILWILRTGAPWRDLPSEYGSWQTAYSRFRRWQQAGVWEQILAQLQEEAGQDDAFALSLHFIDGSVVRAHQHAAGAKGGTPTRKA